MNDTGSTPLDIEFVRDAFPGLARGWTLFDNAGGSQTLSAVVDRIGEFLIERDVQIGGTYAVSLAAAEALAAGREAARLLVNAERAEEIVFGGTVTILMQNLARAMRGQLSPGDEIIVTVVDHESNIGPWLNLEEFGITIRRWMPNGTTGGLVADDLAPLLNERTRLVCMTHASNILGEINDVAAIAGQVHAVGARLCVDATAYAPHRAIDVRALGVDYYAFSFYKVYGPHHAMLYGRHDHLLELDGHDSGDVARAMEPHRIAIRFGDFHSRRLIEHLELAAEGGVVRVSLVHYNTLEEVDRFTAALERTLAGS